ncbi:MAG: phosphatidate cytidylyltransferase [Bacteroidota bacterium]|nr:phosphatidate cytidylyltransferase [Bacteroidota bacterium]
MSNLGARILVAVVAIPCILLLAWLGGYFWFAFVAAVMGFSVREFAALSRRKGAFPQTPAMLGGGFALLLVFLHERLAADIASVTGAAIPVPSTGQALVWVCILFMLVVLTTELFRNRGSALANAGATVLGTLYIGLFLGTAVGVREIFSVTEFPVGKVFGTVEWNPAMQSRLHAWGGFTMISILATIWICDTAAYFGGVAMGRTPLFPRVSPKKTWEGAACGFVTAVATMVAARYLVLDYLTTGQAVVIGVIVGAAGQIGDLVESLFKRDAGVKDSSEMLPGHGGVFDRFDSLLYVAPLVFLYLDYVVFA